MELKSRKERQNKKPPAKNFRGEEAYHVTTAISDIDKVRRNELFIVSTGELEVA